MSDLIKKLSIEKKELDEKRSRLGDFIISERYLGLSVEHQLLLATQASVMAAYSKILAHRISLLQK